MHGVTLNNNKKKKFEISFIHVPGKYDTVKKSSPRLVKIKKKHMSDAVKNAFGSLGKTKIVFSEHGFGSLEFGQIFQARLIQLQ